MKPVIRLLIAGLALPLVTASLQAQDQPGSQNPNRAAADAPPDRPPGPGPDGPPPFGPGGGRGPGGPQEIKIVEKFDKNGDKRLDAEERKPAREFLAKERAEGRLGRGPGGPGGRGRGPGQGPAGNEANRPPGDAPPPRGPEGRPGGPEGFGRRENQPPPQPGPKLTPAEVKNHPEAPLYDTGVLQTLFLEFDNAEWEKEMVDFKGTDVEVPAKLTVDGKVYNDVGVHFRGASSFGVGEGRKRSLNLSLDFIHKKQDLKGYRTLNLLNSNGDPTFLRAALYHRIAREYLPSPQANWVRVVINGESWGVYVNVQQFNKDFIEEWFGTAKGARWKAPGRPNGNSGLEYLGEEVAEYKKRFEIKSKDEEPSWKALIELCRVLNQTPPAELQEKLSPLLDIDGALKFLALENIFINTDGYWTRASDFSLYRDIDGRFHIVPHDVNETFRLPEGPGMRGGGGGEGGGLALDPLAGAEDARKPLLSKLLAVPALRDRYLRQVRDITQKWLDWNKLAPLAQQYQALIAGDVKADTRKLSSFEAFEKGVAEDTEEQGFRGPRRSVSLKSFVEQRRAHLLGHPAIKALDRTAAAE